MCAEFYSQIRYYCTVVTALYVLDMVIVIKRCFMALLHKHCTCVCNLENR